MPVVTSTTHIVIPPPVDQTALAKQNPLKTVAELEKTHHPISKAYVETQLKTYGDAKMKESGVVDKLIGKLKAVDPITLFTWINANKSGKKGTALEPAGMFLIDCRSQQYEESWKEVQWQFPGSLVCGTTPPTTVGAAIDYTNKFAETFKNIATTIAPPDPKVPKYVVFYDTHGKGRAPEICARYIHAMETTPQKGTDPKLSDILTRQTVCFLEGGLDEFYNLDILFRILQVTVAQPFAEPWLSTLVKKPT